MISAFSKTEIPVCYGKAMDPYATAMESYLRFVLQLLQNVFNAGSG